MQTAPLGGQFGHPDQLPCEFLLHANSVNMEMLYYRTPRLLPQIDKAPGPGQEVALLAIV